VVGHDDPGMKLELSHFLLSIANRVNQEFGNISATKVKRTCAGLVQESVHGDEGSSRGSG
jgi:hypothetical protein